MIYAVYLGGFKMMGFKMILKIVFFMASLMVFCSSNVLAKDSSRGEVQKKQVSLEDKDSMPIYIAQKANKKLYKKRNSKKKKFKKHKTVRSHKKTKEKTSSSKPWSLSTTYQLNSDLLQKKEIRRYNHQFILGGSYKLNKKNTLSSSLNLGYFSIVNAIPTERNMEFKSFSLSYGYGEKVSLWGIKNQLNLSASISFPVDEVSRYEGIYFYSIAGLSFKTPFTKKWSLKNQINFNYAWNRYDVSPGTGNSQTLYSGAYTLSTTYLLKPFSLMLGTGIRTRVRVNGLATAQTRNFVGANYGFKKYSLSLIYSNGSYVDAETLALTFVDKFRQLITLSIGASF